MRRETFSGSVIEEGRHGVFISYSFRSATIKAAIERCKTPMEVKAVSDNYGHNDVRTTFDYIKLTA